MRPLRFFFKAIFQCLFNYLVSGTDQTILVNSSSIQPVDFTVYLGEGISIGIATSNQSTSLMITAEEFFVSSATIEVFVNTSVSFTSLAHIRKTRSFLCK